MTMIMDPNKYFDSLTRESYRAYDIAKLARSKGLDPVDDVEIALTKDIASRVEGLLELKGIGDSIRAMEKEGKERFAIAVGMTKAIAKGELLSYPNAEKRVESAVRVGVAILTEGVLVAPTEGIVKVEVNKNEDGTSYVSIYFAGPIRSAGASTAAMSVVLADIARLEAGLGTYKPTEEEIDRIVEEIELYESRVAHMQYYPPEEHIRIIYGSCPVCIDGESTSDEEVSVHRNLPRMKTNRVRGGIPLVVCEGIAQKAAKIKKNIDKLGLKDWEFMSKIIKVKQKAKEGEKNIIEVKPDITYLEGTVAGRPIFAYPSRKGGFRLRYGRSFTNGIMAKNLHPATMALCDDFIACGTHLKMERPGKGAVFSGHDGLEPPVVKLRNGDVVKVKTIEQAMELKDRVTEIIFLGDVLCAYGDFLKSNCPLMPPGYCQEWWALDVKAKGAEPTVPISAEQAFDFAKKTGTPLHPDFLPFWNDISKDELSALIDYVSSGSFDGTELKLPKKQEKRLLELMCLEHRLLGNEVVVEGNNAKSLLLTLGAADLMPDSIARHKGALANAKNSLEFLSSVSGVKIKDKAGTYIGGRMGRPEKAKERMLNCSPNVLYPSGRNAIRNLNKLYQMMKSNSREATATEVSAYRCNKCGKVNAYRKCIYCGGETTKLYKCAVCGMETLKDTHCDKPSLPYREMDIDLMNVYEMTRERLGFSSDDIKGVEGMMSASKIPERLEKGFLRAKHNVFIFKDGTSRFDATDMPLTHFIPKDIGITVEQARKLGYEADYTGAPLESDAQIVPLMLQDIILAESGVRYLTKVANFIDDMLISLYGLEPFYKIGKKDDLLGHLVIGLSPHTSAGVVGRIIGFTKSNVGYAHPFFQTAKRRNCDGDEDAIMLLMDGFLNFSKKFLSSNRGGTMDAPLVLTIAINPKEVDDESHDIEMLDDRHYPLEFYEAAEAITMPGEVKLKRIKNILGTDDMYGEIPFTHPMSSISLGPTRTRYVQLKSIPDKIAAQVGVMSKIRALDMKDAMEKLILSHFIPDIYGNLRRFSRQSVRCKKCNAIFRRIPLSGKCMKCGSDLLLTIYQGTIEKYLDIAKKISLDYGLPFYMLQRLDLVAKEIESVFNSKSRQKGIGDFM